MLFMGLLLVSIPCVMAGTGGLRISQSWPIMTETPATFTIWTQNADSYDVNILLIATQECYDDMTTGVEVTFDTTTVNILKGDFNLITGSGGVYVPLSGTTNGARYTVASLKDHLDFGLDEALESGDTIYWAMMSLGNDFDPLTTEPKEIIISLDSTNPRMLVYLLGKSENDADLFDMKVPPTIPGFMVPEIAIGSIMAVSTMFAALGLFAYKKKHPTIK